MRWNIVCGTSSNLITAQRVKWCLQASHSSYGRPWRATCDHNHQLEVFGSARSSSWLISPATVCHHQAAADRSLSLWSRGFSSLVEWDGSCFSCPSHPLLIFLLRVNLTWTHHSQSDRRPPSLSSPLPRLPTIPTTKWRRTLRKPLTSPDRWINCYCDNKPEKSGGL